uniref:translation initiation factor IF-2 N-terminal domain-containing protein n=1 Tax=Gordonia sp. B7-2 TaxID=3420932 RepID=UPI003D8C178A
MTDNGSPADANAASGSAEQFSSRLRVHALARALGVTSRQVLAHLAELGAQIRSAQSSVEPDVAQAVADRVRHHVEVDASSLAAVDVAAVDVAGGVDVAGPEAPEAETATVEAATPAPDAEAATPVTDTQAAAPAVATEAGSAPAEVDTTQVEAQVEEPATAQPTLFSAASSQYDRPIADESAAVAAGPLFLQPQAPERGASPAPKRDAPDQASAASDASDKDTGDKAQSDSADSDDDSSSDEGSGDSSRRRRRRGRRGRGRGRGEQGSDDTRGDDAASDDAGSDGAATDDAGSDGAVSGATDNDTAGPADGSESSSGSQDDAGGGDGSGAKKSGKPSGKKGKKSKKKTSDAQGEGSGGDADTADEDAASADEGDSTDSDADNGAEGSSTRRRRRRRRRKGGADSDESSSPDDPPNTVVHEREPRSKRARDEVQGISGSTRLEAKRQRRRDGRDAGRRRPPILTESEFLARREAVDRVMVVRERSANSRIALGGGDDGGHGHATPVEDYTQVAVLEDGVLVEHFVTTETSSSMVGNIYLGRVQNVLPGMEAAFVDIGRGRNGVLYAGEVNWDAAGLDGGSRKIEQALKPGDNVLVQVSKDPVGHKGARLTTQISLAGRYLVYVPGGSSTGISRKLPDVERKRLKQILAKLVPDDAGVIIRTASEGVSAEDLGADIARLEAQWKAIDESVAGAKKGSGASNPKALYEEPDLLVRVVRDLFNEDFKKLVVEGDKAWSLVDGYVSSVAPDLMERVEKFDKAHADAPDSFVVHRIDEQLAKALDRKVWLPSGGTLIIEHTEAMTVVDVNTGKFTGSGGNLEETVTRNNLEAAEEIVRQMRLRDIGGMIIVDFIDMVLESNRDLVLRRLTEALARDRTRHQVSEVTSLGLVQMTRKRLGTGLLEAFSTTCTTCGGRGIIVHANPVEVRTEDTNRTDGAGSKRSRRGKRKTEAAPEAKPAHKPAEHPMFRAMAAHAHDEDDDTTHVEAATDGDAATSAADEVDTSTPQDDSTQAPDSPPTTEATVVAEPDAVVDESVGDADAEEPSSEPDVAAVDYPDDAAVTPKRRRRVVRRAASPTTAPEPVVITAQDAAAAPLTTFGPASGAGTESVVAVRRRPRRRTAGRPAGPPPAEQ